WERSAKRYSRSLQSGDGRAEFWADLFGEHCQIARLLWPAVAALLPDVARGLTWLNHPREPWQREDFAHWAALNDELLAVEVAALGSAPLKPPATTTAVEMITIERIAELAGVQAKTVNNRLSESRRADGNGAPAPVRPRVGRAPALYAYGDVRPWALAQFPSRAEYFPASLADSDAKLPPRRQ
ncbi:MAG TPA: hypothetical protein PJ982_04200, partial [Lacipirellulaceae bacterium]|nr:hypothetical protein [Lacipirellulaceae bacterium]